MGEKKFEENGEHQKPREGPLTPAGLSGSITRVARSFFFSSYARLEALEPQTCELEVELGLGSIPNLGPIEPFAQ